VGCLGRKSIIWRTYIILTPPFPSRQPNVLLSTGVGRVGYTVSLSDSVGTTDTPVTKGTLTVGKEQEVSGLQDDTTYTLNFEVVPPDTEPNVNCAETISFTTSCTGEMGGSFLVLCYETARRGQARPCQLMMVLIRGMARQSRAQAGSETFQ